MSRAGRNSLGKRSANWQDAFIYFKHEESGIGPKLARANDGLVGLMEPIEQNLARVRDQIAAGRGEGRLFA